MTPVVPPILGYPPCPDHPLPPSRSQLKPHAAAAIAEYTRNPAFYQVWTLKE